MIRTVGRRSDGAVLVALGEAAVILPYARVLPLASALAHARWEPVDEEPPALPEHLVEALRRKDGELREAISPFLRELMERRAQGR
ncbi:hypothetical protein ACFXJ8_00920 [Nonomuraea sp. NPDC059194]|uniref:hypothetical protein n=1 Tax=Nonomuraea sp. NPDC059194 TaxID=3346764 RepID=UPI0036CDA7E7